MIREGDRPIFVPFLLRGIVRGFLLDVNGHEITDCFAVQPGIPVMTAADLRMPSPLYLEATVPCDFLAVPVSEIQRLLGEYSELQSLYNQLLIDSFSMHWEIKLTLCRSTAMQKYQWFLQKYPGLINQISHKYIASFFRNHSSDAQPPAPCAPRTKLSCTICNGTSVKGGPFFLGCYPRIMHIVPVYAIIKINWNSLSRTGVCGMSTVKN